MVKAIVMTMSKITTQHWVYGDSPSTLDLAVFVLDTRQIFP